MPTSTERFTNAIGSLFAFTAPGNRETLNTLAPAPPPPAGIINFDFDGDGKADAGRWRYSNTEFKVWNSNGGSYSIYSVGCNPSTTSGCGSAKPVPGDYDGNGTTDAAIYSSGTWKYKASPNSAEVILTNSLGQSGDIPVPANYDGTGPTDQAVFRPSNGTWYVINSAGSTSVAFGQAGDIPVPGSYSGSGVQLAVFRPSNGTWYVRDTNGGFVGYQWGISSDVPVPADYDGDGKTDIAVFRRTTGSWYILKSSSNFTAYDSYAWGNYGDQPAPADYDGDGKADPTIWRPTTGGWWILKSSGGYTSLSLGEQGDFAVTSAYVRQVGGTMTSDQVAAARLSPRNETGGTNLYSQNFSWGTQLVSLPGRSGLDLNLGIGYNSLVWTKVGSEVYFDTDWSNVSPGFRLGFPTIQPAYYDAAKQKYAYMMVTPSGARKEFRQTAASNVYETADSSYAQLVVTAATNPNTPGGPNDSPDTVAIKVITTDGTQSTYEWKNGEYHCKEIKDRNGNFITITNNDAGQIDKVKDTLGRFVTVEYDTDGYPIKIKQDWKSNNGTGSTLVHEWATFSYTTKTVNTEFASSLTVLGPPSGTVLKVLDKVTYADGSSSKFDYIGYAQVYKVSQIAADSTSHVLNYVRTNLESPASGQSDCPRFTETRDWVENFNQNQSGGAQERVTTNSLTPNSTFTLGDGHTGTATKIEVAMTGDPYNSVTRTYVGSSGWSEGLTLATEDWADNNGTSERKRWTWTGWTQDDTSKSYILNPRVTETRVGDDALNVKSTSYSYCADDPCTQNLPYGLVKSVTVTNPNNSSVVLKQVRTEYNLDSVYTSRRIIGLPSMVEAWGRNDLTGSPEYVSKVTYGYDEGNFADTSLLQNISPVQHDPSYGDTFIAGRGNLTSTIRWNAQFPTNAAEAVTSSIKYNTAGSLVEQTGPGEGTTSRTLKIGYTDGFNSSVTGATYAYPTTLTDPAGSTLGDPAHSSTVVYRYDIGANVQATSPAPAGNSYGKKTKRIYSDFYGRLERDSVYLGTQEYAYTRYEYPSNNGVQVRTYSTVTDTNSNGLGDTADEVISESWLDGAGRVRMSRTEHPGSAGGWTATQTEYDKLGRVSRQSVPTEVSVSGTTWTPAGDDAARGWLWTIQKYDWKGRVVRKINTDGADSPTLNDSDVLISYDGCGCAGGQVTTIKSETVPRDDVPASSARRTQKIYEDILGRSWKTVVYKWDGTTPYTTTEQYFNGRDQVVKTKQIDNTSTSTPQSSQEVAMTYDGHGRMKTRHYPIEDPGTFSTWNYNPDDSVSQLVDPRGATTNFAYNDPRGLLTQVSYSVPNGSTISVTPTTTFDYDNVGNRTGMDTAGVSQTTYNYDPLSRLTSETVDFDDLSSNLTISYTYHIAGPLKSITDPFGAEINYTNDKTGRVTAVSGANYGPHSNGDYVNNIQYRAFGQVKRMDYATPTGLARIELGYDSRLRVSHSEASMPGSTSSFLMKADYSYFADSRLAAKDDTVSDQWDRTNTFDFAGRLVFNQFGMGPATNVNEGNKRVYQQVIAYDAFSQMTSRSTLHWDAENYFDATYTSGRKNPRTYEGLTYDAAGNIVHSQPDTLSPYNLQDTTFDGSGRRTAFVSKSLGRRGGLLNYVSEEKDEVVFDGDGRPVIEKRGYRSYHISNVPTTALTTSVTGYQVWSSVLGSSLTALDPAGNKVTTNVFAGGALVAKQTRSTSGSTTTDGITWSTADPVTGTVGKYSFDGTASTTSTDNFEPLGQNIFPNDPEEYNPPSGTQGMTGNADEPEWKCEERNATWFWGEFHNWPVGCQRRYWTEMTVTQMLPATDKRENPIEIVDSPILDLDIPFSEEKEMMSFALGSTAKQQEKPRGKRKPILKPGRRLSKEELARKRAIADTGVFDTEKKQALPPPFDPSRDGIEDLASKGVIFLQLMINGTKFIGFSESEANQIRRRVLTTVFWKPCVDAYKALPGNRFSPAEVLRDRGITFVNSTVLGDPNIENDLGEENARALRLDLKAHIDGGAVGATATKNVKRVVTALNINSFWSNYDEDVFHEIAHGTGVPGRQSAGGLGVHHDLDYLQGSWVFNTVGSYDKLLDACNPPLTKW